MAKIPLGVWIMTGAFLLAWAPVGFSVIRSGVQPELASLDEVPTVLPALIPERKTLFRSPFSRSGRSTPSTSMGRELGSPTPQPGPEVSDRTPRLIGVVGGPPWAALVDGWTDRGTLVLPEGDTVTGLWAVHVSGDSTVLESPRGRWTLFLPRGG